MVHHSCSASVSVPIVNSVFTSVLQFIVTPNLECDAVLGLDWIGLCQDLSNDDRWFDYLSILSVFGKTFH
jgi:hypothetical protein